MWARHELATTKKRLRALEAKMAQDGLVLTESQVAAFEKAQGDKEAHGEFADDGGAPIIRSLREVKRKPNRKPLRRPLLPTGKVKWSQGESNRVVGDLFIERFH